MAITSLNLSSYVGKQDGQTLPASTWNALFTTIQNKVNEVILALGTGGSGGGGTTTESSEFYVNGTLTPPVNGVVTLNPEGTYTLKGKLYGRVEIAASASSSGSDTPATASEGEGGSSATISDDTFITLDGVEIISSSTTNEGIAYKPTSQSLVVTLAKNTNNVIVCTNVATMAAQQKAALYSENNMIIQGVGYLSCINKGGHGIKASELRISGRPHVYVEAIHDGIHGNSKLTIDDGYYFINKANDAFGTGTSGSISIFGGSFYCYNITQNCFDSKTDGHYYCDTLDVHTDVASANRLSGISAFNPATHLSAGTVKCYSDDTKSVSEGENPVITPVGGVYTITKPYVEIEGYIQGQIAIGIQNVEVVLGGAYITYGGEGPTISYTPSKSNVCVKTAKNTINIVKQTATTKNTSINYDAIKSENNLKLEIKGGSHLVLHSVVDDGADGTDVTITDSKGVMIVNNCGLRGLKGTTIYLATSKDEQTEGTGSGKIFGGALICYNNYRTAKKTSVGDASLDNSDVGVADIYARNGGKYSKGSLVFDSTQMFGVLCCGSIAAFDQIDMAKTPCFYYNELVTGSIVGDVGKTYEPYDVIPYGVGSIPLF